MASYGLFSPSIMGLRSQSHALDVIGVNVANINTNGYKQSDVHFRTMVSDKLFEQSDIGGARNKDFFRIARQGNIMSTDLNTDLAIAGRGFFVLNSQMDGSGETVYSRDGSFRMVNGPTETVTIDGADKVITSGYLVDKNGYYVMGWAAQEDGSFAEGSLTALRVDPYAFLNQGQETTEALLVMNLDGAEKLNGNYRYYIDVYDSAGQRQIVDLLFTKNAILNQWDVTTQVPGFQTDNVTLGGTVEADDVYTVTIDGNPVSYTVTGLEADMDAVRDALVAAINADPTVSAIVTASVNDMGGIALRSNTLDATFTTAVSTTQGLAAVPQEDTVTVGGTVEAGDIYRVLINGHTVEYVLTGGEADMDAVRDAIVAAINADPQVNTTVTAAPGGPGELTLTADTAGTPFVATVETVNAGVTNDNTAAIVNTVENLAIVEDNSITLSPNSGILLGNLQFKPTGEVDWPLSFTLDLAFDGDTTATVELDISNMTQYAGQYVPKAYEKNGRISASMVNWSFDQNGQINATFEDHSVRAIYKVPLAVFVNPDGLDIINGQLFKESAYSGDVRIVSAGSLGQAQFIPNALETSNVILEEQFTRMILTQTAYNASSTAFKTVDEMTVVAKDLKR